MDPDEARLSDIGVGQSATVKRVRNARRVALRLLELGLLPGTPVTVVRKAPMGDPLELRLRDFSLSIRAAEAELVDVVRTNGKAER